MKKALRICSEHSIIYGIAVAPSSKARIVANRQLHFVSENEVFYSKQNDLERKRSNEIVSSRTQTHKKKASRSACFLFMYPHTTIDTMHPRVQKGAKGCKRVQKSIFQTGDRHDVNAVLGFIASAVAGQNHLEQWRLQTVVAHLFFKAVQ